MLNSRIKYNIKRKYPYILHIGQSYETLMLNGNNIISIKREIIDEEMMTAIRRYYNKDTIYETQ